MSPQSLNPEEAFEDQYTQAFIQRFQRRGLEINYKRDRAARDLGFHLTAPGSMRLSDVRVWFQLKGIHATTLSGDEISGLERVAVTVDLDDVRNWYSAPEAVYLVVYLEAIDDFVGEDVRNIVDGMFAGIHGVAAKLQSNQDSLRLYIDLTATIDSKRIDSMLGHKSMRIDGPAWRGRPLGHRFDPLRSELAHVDRDLFIRLVSALLTAHEYEIERKLDAGLLIAEVADHLAEAYLSVGVMHSTYEWLFQGSVEFGDSPGQSFREEGQTMSVQGRTLVLVVPNAGASLTPSTSAVASRAALNSEGIQRCLVIANVPDVLAMAYFRAVLADLYELPQGLGSLAYSVLTTTLVYLEFQDQLRWNFVNYLWQPIDFPPVDFT